VDAYFLDNVDPDAVASLLDRLPLDETVVNVVSKSGTTAETLANFLVVREAMAEAGVDWTDRTLVTTGEEGNLRALADAHDLPVLDVPDGVPGRFSALSTVGLAVPALQGHDIEAILAGGRDGMESLSGSLFETPAYAYGTATYALAERGALTNAVMPYAESLETFAEWFAQLWAESLGKDGLGQTPARALGATDQHSQLQLYRAGPPDKLVSLIRPTERAETEIPETDLDGLAYLGGSSLGDLLDAEFEATEASLAAADVPNLRVGSTASTSGARRTPVRDGGRLRAVRRTRERLDVHAARGRVGKKAARGLLGGGDFRRPTPWPTSANCGSTAPEPGESISPIPSPWTSGRLTHRALNHQR